MSLAEEAARHVEAQIVHDAALELLASHLGSAAQLAGVHVLDVRERDMILAALRYWLDGKLDSALDIARGDHDRRLDDVEIDALCDRLNGI